MIVYGSRERPADTAAVIDGIERAAAALRRAGTVAHEDAVAALIDIGAAEAAWMDALCPERDADPPVARVPRACTRAAGRVVEATWRGEADEARRRAQALHAATLDLRRCELPRRIALRVPEGYAFYALYPEGYGEAARRFARRARPGRTVVIGIRSIGTSLSAVVAAALEDEGGEVETWTVRPRGHPFHRVLDLSPGMRAALAARAERWFAVVDEGPGLSGSSFASVADALAGLGVPHDRIVFFPSWDPDPSTLRSDRAREAWPRHARYLTPFESVWPGRSEGPGLVDLSAGRWRDRAFESAGEYPAVHPQHERRKYARASPTGRVLLKFEGLGSRGRSALDRAQRLAEEGYGPRPLRLAHGFVEYEWLEGRPLATAAVDTPALTRVGEYIAFLARTFATGEAAPWEDALEMVRVNASEGLALDCGRALSRLRVMGRSLEGVPAVAVDGRLLAHEWIRSAMGTLRKTDGVDHHDDHFWPGARDAAWDVAGAAVELDLERAAEDQLVDAYVRASGDAAVRARLPFHRTAYLAYRLGYASLAVETLGASDDARRFARLRDGYGAALRSQLEALS